MKQLHLRSALVRLKPQGDPRDIPVFCSHTRLSILLHTLKRDYLIGTAALSSGHRSILPDHDELAIPLDFRCLKLPGIVAARIELLPGLQCAGISAPIEIETSLHIDGIDPLPLLQPDGGSLPAV